VWPAVAITMASSSVLGHMTQCQRFCVGSHGTMASSSMYAPPNLVELLVGAIAEPKHGVVETFELGVCVLFTLGRLQSIPKLLCVVRRVSLAIRCHTKDSESVRYLFGHCCERLRSVRDMRSKKEARKID
jgi:hypothetical protein